MNDNNRFWKRVDIPDDDSCWEWQGAVGKNGYGRLHWNGKHDYAHRVAMMIKGHQYGEGEQTDHLCRNRLCVNVKHLEIVDQATNLYRGNGWSGLNKRKKECINGHPLEGENLDKNNYGWRVCKKCRQASQKRSYDRAKLEEENRRMKVALGEIAGKLLVTDDTDTTRYLQEGRNEIIKIARKALNDE